MDKVKFEIEFPIHASPRIGNTFSDFIENLGIDPKHEDETRSPLEKQLFQKRMKRKQDISGLKAEMMKVISNLEYKLMKLPKTYL